MCCEPQTPLHNAGDLFFIQPMSRSQRRRGRKAYRRIQIRAGESRHHRLPRSRSGSSEDSNISVVKQDDHNHFHALFSNYSVHTIAAILNEKWIDPKYRLIVEEVKI